MTQELSSPALADPLNRQRLTGAVAALWRIWSALVWALAFGCAIAALAAHGGRFSGWLDILTHFAPFWLAGAMLAAVAAFSLQRGWSRRGPLLLGLIGVAASVGLIAPELLRPMPPLAPANAPRQIKLVQFNAKQMLGPREEAARWIVAQNPDLITLEEVTPELRDAILAQRPYHVSPDIVSCSLCRTIVMSRIAPADAGIGENWVRRWRAPMARMTFAEKDGGFTFMAAHQTWPIPPGPQQAGLDQLGGVLARFPTKRLILAGDFNSTPWSFSLQRLDRRFGLQRRDRALFSWPAGPVTARRIVPPFAFLPIDHVFAGSDWRTVKIERGPKGLGSDHLPLVVTLALDPR